ncbi:MAG TPA: hypothetical protein PLD99_01285 [Parcubacteria group bacterium]|nr:hypothetical protein [Parcubacteria group bacterium]
MTKPADPHGQKVVEKDEDDVSWYTDWRWLGIILLLILMLGLVIFRPWDKNKEEVAEAVSTPETNQVDSTSVTHSSPMITLPPAPKYCDVSDSTQTFCSSDPQTIEVLQNGELRLANLGEVRICARKPIKSITYKVVPNGKFDFTSSLDIENPRCDKFFVTRGDQ